MSLQLAVPLSKKSQETSFVPSSTEQYEADSP